MLYNFFSSRSEKHAHKIVPVQYNASCIYFVAIIVVSDGIRDGQGSFNETRGASFCCSVSLFSDFFTQPCIEQYHNLITPEPSDVWQLDSSTVQYSTVYDVGKIIKTTKIISWGRRLVLWYRTTTATKKQKHVFVQQQLTKWQIGRFYAWTYGL